MSTFVGNNPFNIGRHASGRDYLGQDGFLEDGAICNFASVSFGIRAFLTELHFITADNYFRLTISEFAREVTNRIKSPHLYNGLVTKLCDVLRRGKSSLISILEPLKLYRLFDAVFVMCFGVILEDYIFDYAYAIFVENLNTRKLFEI